MRIRIDKWLVILVVIALSTLSWWMPMERGRVTYLAGSPEKRHIVDYDLTDFDLTTMNAEGRPGYQLQAQSLRHYADDDTTDVNLPQMTMYSQGAPPWFARAEQAHATAGGETVLLRDQVRVRRLTNVKGDRLEIQTSLLRVVPAKDYADTAEPVTIVSDLGVTHAVGMRADLKQKQIDLLSQVRGVYAAQ